MLNTIIIEDERPAMELLVQAITEADKSVQINALLTSLEQARSYLSSGQQADLIFSDVQLADGYSFDLFKETKNKIPVVFVTGYDEYIINAFSANGIDYLLKPVSREEIRTALNKYNTLKQHFVSYQEPKKRSRLVVRRGLEWLTLKLDDIVMLYTENKLVYILDRDGKKYIGEKNLSEMAHELEERYFFRANRQHILNINFIKGFRSFDKVKLLVELKLPDLNKQIIVSQENAPCFRNWICGA